MSVLVVMSVGLAAFLVSYTTLALALSEERHVHNRLERLSSFETSQAVAAEPMLAPFSQRVLAPFGASIGRMVRTLAPTVYLDSVATKLVHAGSPRGIDAVRLFTIQVFMGIGAGLVVGIGRAATGESVWTAAALGLVAALAAFAIPLVWITMRANKRQDAIRRELPDMLDMLLISVEAGLGFDGAVAKIVRRSHGPLGEEFARMLQDGQAGLSRRESLRRLSERNDVAELRAFIMAMVQADVFGVSVSNVLRAQAREMRIKRRQRAQEMAQKAPAKMVFPLILCVLPATLIVLAGPAVISIMRAFGGAP